MSYIIRPAEKKDADQIAELLVGILKLHADGRPDIFRDCGAKYSSEDVSAMIDDPSKRIWVADDMGNVLGYLISVIQTHDGHVMSERTVLWIDDLCIAPDRRRSGIGEALVSCAVEFARSSNYSGVELNVWAFNTNAVSFYEKQGFKPQRTVMEFKT